LENEVATLRNEEKAIGNHKVNLMEVIWQAASISIDFKRVILRQAQDRVSLKQRR